MKGVGIGFLGGPAGPLFYSPMYLKLCVALKCPP